MEGTGTARATSTAVLAGLIVVAGIAGTATAVKKIGTRALRNRAVTTAKLRDAAVTEPKIADGAVSGAKVRDGSLALEDVAEAVVSVSFTPPNLGPTACNTSTDLAVAGMDGSQNMLVLPGSSEDGWPDDLFLDAYGRGGPGAVRARVCNMGSGFLDSQTVPLLVLTFGR